MRHSPQPQVECYRPSPFNPDRAASTCPPPPRLHSSGREARSPTRGIQGSGPAHPPTTTLSPHSLHGGIRPAPRGLTQGAPASVGEAAEAPQGQVGRSASPGTGPHRLWVGPHWEANRNLWLQLPGTNCLVTVRHTGRPSPQAPEEGTITERLSAGAICPLPENMPLRRGAALWAPPPAPHQGGDTSYQAAGG